MITDSIKKYEQKTGENFEIPADCEIKIIGDEFMIWKLGLHNEVPFFYIDQMYGQMVNFREFIREVCKAADIEWIVTATQRNPKAHCRKWNMERLSEFDYEHEGRFYYVLKGHISNLK